MAVQYRSVDKEQLIASISAAAAWLKTLDLGPVSASLIEDMHVPELIDRISGAQTDSDLAKVMRESGIGRLLFRFHDVIAYEPEVFPGEKPLSGEPPRLFRQLASWGAFSPNNNDGSSQELDEEERRFRILTALAHFAQKGLIPGSPEDKRLGAALAERPSDEEVDRRITDTLDTIVPIFVLMAQDGQQDGIRGMMPHYIHELPALLDALHAAMGVKAPSGISLANQPIMPYAVAMKGQATDYSGMEYDDIRTMLEPLKQKLRVVLEPFYDTDEATRISTGTIGELNKFGVFFYATSRAAQAVADKLNDVDVIDFNGRQIKPRPAQGYNGGVAAPGM